jgi:hypothetical protein
MKFEEKRNLRSYSHFCSFCESDEVFLMILKHGELWNVQEMKEKSISFIKYSKWKCVQCQTSAVTEKQVVLRKIHWVVYR